MSRDLAYRRKLAASRFDCNRAAMLKHVRGWPSRESVERGPCRNTQAGAGWAANLAAVTFRQTGAGEDPGGAGAEGRQGRAGPIDHRDRHQSGDLRELLPAMEGRERIGAHDPDEAHARSAADEVAQGLDREAGTDPRLEPP